MTFSSARKTLLCGRETSAWGTAVTANKDLGLIQDISDNLTREVTEHSGVGSIETQAITTGQFGVGQSITMKYQHGRPLAYIIGTVTHTNSSTDYKHTFTHVDNPPSMTVNSSEQGTSNVALDHAGMLVDSAELSIALNEALKLKIELKGKTPVSSTTTSTAVISSIPPFGHNECHVLIGGATACEVQNFSIKIDKKVELSGGVGNNQPQQGHATELRCSFSGTLGFTDKTYQELIMGGTTVNATTTPTASAIQLYCDNGVAYGSGQRNLDFNLAGGQFDKFDKVASVGSLIFVDVSGKGKLGAVTNVDTTNTTLFW